MIYSVNQNRQFYVVNKVVTTTPKALGEVQAIKTKDGKTLMFKHFGQGGLTRSDAIVIDSISSVQRTDAKAMQKKIKKAVISLDSTVNEGQTIVGQDYVLRIEIEHYLAPGDASKLIKSGAVHVYKDVTDTPETFYAKFADILTKSFSREPQAMVTFEASATGIVVKGVADQPWRLGVYQQEVIDFEVTPTTVTYNGDQVQWGTVEYSTDGTIGNGKDVADLEYFCMAERGDVFRNTCWPYNIDVKYLVDPDKEYNLVDVHFSYSGDGVQVHKSEKDITFAVADSTALTALVKVFTDLGIVANVTTA
jgi:hypothetical protein